MNCPCQSGKSFAECCEPLIKGEEKAETAEQLMRSRYTAYTQVNMDYIEKTHDPKTRKNSDMEANRRWAESAKWFGLEVLSTEGGGPDDDDGMVEFIARYDLGEGEEEHHEHSLFRKENGGWYYSDSRNSQETYVREEKIGRNDPCPCGSGKKYKKCCGKAA